MIPVAAPIQARCRRCGGDFFRPFFLFEVVEATTGECPRCHRPLSPDWTPVLRGEARRADAAQRQLVSALRRLVGLPGNLEILPHSVLRNLFEEIGWERALAAEPTLISEEVRRLREQVQAWERLIRFPRSGAPSGRRSRGRCGGWATAFAASDAGWTRDRRPRREGRRSWRPPPARRPERQPLSSTPPPMPWRPAVSTPSECWRASSTPKGSRPRPPRRRPSHTIRSGTWDEPRSPTAGSGGDISARWWPSRARRSALGRGVPAPGVQTPGRRAPRRRREVEQRGPLRR